MTPATLLYNAETLLHIGRPDEALAPAQQALSVLLPNPQTPTPAALPAINLIAEINLGLGNPSIARDHFLTAVSLDRDGSLPESEGGGAEKFLWLAQLSEEGGRESVEWFEKGAEVLRRQIMGMLGADGEGEAGDEVEGLMKRLASALCGIVEIYMTDLSWEADAESHCEKLITEALLTAPNAPEPLQTLASIRISQTRIPEAKKALSDSVALWKDLPPEDPNIPAFPTRISLARLLMEVEMEDDALMVVERLVSEDDQSIEAWYLGGWCLFLLGQKGRDSTKGMEERNGETDNDGGDAKSGGDKEEKYLASLVSSRDWLKQSLTLYNLLDYEDDRLRDHAMELVEGLDKELAGLDGSDADELGQEGEGRDTAGGADEDDTDGCGSVDTVEYGSDAAELDREDEEMDGA